MRLLSTFLFALSLASAAFAENGLIKLQSAHDVATTADRLENVLRNNGMKVFIRVDHAKGAAGVDLQLPATELVVFGNPKAGTPLMQCARTTAIDLPQKALIWQGADGTTWLAYNDPQYLKQRHAIEGCDKVLGKVAQALNKFATAATAP